MELTQELNIHDSVSDMFKDIANGICGSQTLLNGEMLKTKKSKMNDYVAKTPISSIINDILTPFLDEIHKSRGWNGDNEFVSGGSVIRLIHWELNDDWCMVNFNGNKEQKINKKWFRELYNNKEDI